MHGVSQTDSSTLHISPLHQRPAPHLNLRSIPVGLLNTTDWDEWQTSCASISSLILLVGPFLHIWYPPGLLLLWPRGTRRGFKEQIRRPGGSACWHAYLKDVGLNSVGGSCCAPGCHSSYWLVEQEVNTSQSLFGGNVWLLYVFIIANS